ncbi:FAD-dependent oxidoreductase [Parabacteroides sp. FAFU027]|uniref:FAD-dependent oxidoreductase n=1 Tax=Parabacteroides sp. FAFU027 TaxID=2922715 RepID=UPI001FB0320B|nr:FAD-dependent oxidoreductase [Parabacteroides sp. FAFU027]
MKKTLGLFISFLLAGSTLFAAELLVEAESFINKGGWVVDQQFMDVMGSPYIMAHGMGKPVADASTTVTFPGSGTYYVYVRTFNWTFPWAKGTGPGAFTLKVGGKRLSTTLGTEGSQWMWQKAGTVSVKDKQTTLVLSDLSGFNGRCDAIYFTTEKGSTPPADVNELALFRKKLLNIPLNPGNVEKYDLVVVGGGVAGMCAATAAARLGCKVALIHDRPVLGGNNSSEVRVHLGGSIEKGKNAGLGRMIREFGHTREGNAQKADVYEDEKKSDFIANEKNITLFTNCHATAVTTKDGKIESVLAKQVETGNEISFKAPIFADCTGDGTIGYLAGADYRMGRESRDEFGEDLAPEKADKMTMGASVQWYSVADNKPNSFPHFKYGVDFNEKNCEKVTMGEWKWETGMNFDQIKDFERVRDYGLLVVYSNWSFLKNELKDNQKYQSRKLEWVAYIAGKRESRRLMGDYILKQDDIDKNMFHEDASFTTTWSIDLHTPDTTNSKTFPDAEFKSATKHIYIYPYSVPYRCLYSRNVDNLFMAGRNISATHVALGTVRVMRTTGMMGEVVGIAAALCKKYNTTPRMIYQSHLDEFKSLMKEGVGKKEGLPDNQKFNEVKNLKQPKYLNKK